MSCTATASVALGGGSTQSIEFPFEMGETIADVFKAGRPLSNFAPAGRWTIVLTGAERPPAIATPSVGLVPDCELSLSPSKLGGNR